MMQTIWLAIGILLAIPFLLLARSRGPERETTILAIGLIGAAIVYVGFAIVWGDALWIAIEVGGLLFYTLFAWLAQRQGARRLALGWLTVGWAAHPLWDIGLHWIGKGDTIAPEWYVFACLSFDLLVAGYLLIRLNQWKVRVQSGGNKWTDKWPIHSTGAPLISVQVFTPNTTSTRN